MCRRCAAPPLPATVVLFLVAVWRVAAASNHLIAIEEVLGSWQGDDAVQFVELRMLAPGQQFLSDGGGIRGAADLVFDDATGSPDTRRVFTFTHDLARGETGARVLVATRPLTDLSGVAPDFVLPPGMLSPRAGRVCYRVNPPQEPFQETGVIDCVAYGKFTGENGRFGRPTPITPDNRSLQRVDLTGSNVDDWRGALEPTPENNAGVVQSLPTLCGDGAISQGEECDGEALGGKTCVDLGFVSGTLLCRQCHFDTRRCSFCGNGVINRREECDGVDLGGRSCVSLGFTGGSLTCTDRCRLSTASCDPTFFVPGGGPPGPECLAEWRVANASGAGRPGADGKAPVRQRCHDGDAGCDADLVAGSCTFTIALCVDRADPRLARGGRACRRLPVESWTLATPGRLGLDTESADRLLAAVGHLGPSALEGRGVTFSPPLDAVERCTDPVTITVPTRGARAGTRVTRALTAAAGGRPRDVDTLRLVCVP